MLIIAPLRANVVYTKACLLFFEEQIKALINRLSLRVVLKPNLLCKVRFEVFRNIIGICIDALGFEVGLVFTMLWTYTSSKSGLSARKSESNSGVATISLRMVNKDTK
jgi:hypothetical protein